MPENEARTIFKNILDAIQILHHHNIVHRDIKDENVLINYETKEIQLIDFGSSTFYEQDKKLSNFVGSYVFAAPEIIQGLTYEGPPQDIWSLGILLYTMIYKNTPFNDYYEILRGKMKFPSGISKECQELILWMTNRDISKRPTIDDVLSHPWINENSFN
ncbi:kinase-like protein [Neocallimastix lanati (nom. inval.)]|uniref:Kinase-like protein n=1 Tax=Neocallimastix californiae TaxID=1754190 RepID=A0A1Y2EG32_9FUNG|nr:kinase-like protein [Neocallimastix sp. JGI-2020a]ORY70532.1 kinase-like protein [Neocallimastix californiae]|eukprot:ORY70532.1 kinase-like protein [Neocallimastix californiae]